MTEYTQVPLLYTEEEVQAKITEARLTASLESAHQTQRAKDFLSLRLCENVVEVFKEYIASGTITADDAFAIYESMAYRNEWDTTNPFLVKKFTVTVAYNGTIIAEFADIEAEDEHRANDYVADNLEIEDVLLNVTVSMNGDAHTGEVNMSYEFDPSELEFVADEQD